MTTVQTGNPTGQHFARTPVRALHVYGSLNRGGAETWLMDVMRHSDRTRLQIDVCVLDEREGAYESEFISLGGQIHRCPLAGNPLRFYRAFRRLLKENEFDVVHSHVYLFSGIVLRAAAAARVPQRVAHIHPIDDVKGRRLLRNAYESWMRRWIVRNGTHFVSPTEDGVTRFWGPQWAACGNKAALYNGIQTERFAKAVDRSDVRRELNLPEEAQIILNVARFAPHKRHGFLVDVAEALVKRNGNVYFLLIGAGDLRERIIAIVADRGLNEHTRFIQGAPDIDPYWLSADAFAFPSCNEGFGIVIAEAAAAGLPVIAQDIPGVREAACACHQVELLPLDTAPEEWSRALERALTAGPLSQEARLERLRQFPFTIERSVENLERLYGIV